MAAIFQYNQPITLETGTTLPGLQLAYTIHGKMNEAKDNVVWVFHALTANSDPAEWWAGLVGDGKLFDPANYCIICVNTPGSCYGSTGPLDINPATGSSWYHDFPYFTTRDMIRSYQLLKNELGIERIHIGMGGSLGGQQLLEWAVEEPELFEHIIPIATNAYHSPWGIAFNASQRFCIENDSSWLQKDPKAGINGMKTARSFALLSYRHYETYLKDQSETDLEKTQDFRSESYQRYQGEKLAARFNAFSYYTLSRSMDSHNVGRGRDSVAAALGLIKARTLSIGITTDTLFPLREQLYLADAIPGAVFKAIHSPYGHDGFLLEFEAIRQIIQDWLDQKESEAGTFREKLSNFNLFL
ncbi:MAG: homoserine O-acetyltransferase [Chitinophagaceae bacterium]|nr:homoserine O-acetyltransferase [Chitinophagaceae bacterium]